MFAIIRNDRGRMLIQGEREKIEKEHLTFRPLKVRTYRAAKAILWYPERFSDKDSIAVREVEDYAWKDSHRLESLPNFTKD